VAEPCYEALACAKQGVAMDEVGLAADGLRPVSSEVHKVGTHIAAALHSLDIVLIGTACTRLARQRGK
jgi:hypothetical protein